MRALVTKLLLAAALICSAAAPAWADFDDGFTAYEAGDYATALKEFRPLAEQGNSDAQFNLGLMYDQGEGVPENDAEAVKWYRLAAEQGHEEAQTNLGWMYAHGEGVPENDAEAVKWYRLAAEQGDAEAQNNLGTMYERGEGVPLNYIKAYMWYSLAKAQVKALAVENLEIIKDDMTAADISKAQALATEWWEENME
jgi:TPR repeat protein